MKDIEVSFDPSNHQIGEIKAWLIEEDKGFKEGFFCNWNGSRASFEEKKIGIIILNEDVIGFITWFGSESVTTIDIAEIKPGFRRMGYGKVLAEALYNKLQKQGVKILELHCQPAKSEKIRKKSGFKDFPDVEGFEDYNSNKGKHLYKILIPFAKPTKSVKRKSESIELWAVGPHLTTRFSPQWIWHLKFEKGSRKLIKPIIFPAKYDWNILWKIDSEIIQENKIKRFQKGNIDFSNFIIIEGLPR